MGNEHDELRLIFACCHPAVPPDARIALCLRELCGLDTDLVARACRVPVPTIAERIERARKMIREVPGAEQLPAPDALPKRLQGVLEVVYRIFNQGQAAVPGTHPPGTRLRAEAIRLGRLLVQGLEEPEALGLLALMLLRESRPASHEETRADLLLLQQQPRSSWARETIIEALGLIDRAFGSPLVGPYVLQAAIAAVHAEAPTFDQTDWARIVALYDRLVCADPSPAMALNRAAVLGMCHRTGSGCAGIQGPRPAHPDRQAAAPCQGPAP